MHVRGMVYITRAPRSGITICFHTYVSLLCVNTRNCVNIYAPLSSPLSSFDSGQAPGLKLRYRHICHMVFKVTNG